MAAVEEVFKRLEELYRKWHPPVVTEIARQSRDPFRVLVSCILSLRTKDETTKKAAERLFQRARMPEEILSLSEKEIAKLIYPVGFYNTKAKTLKEISKAIVEKYGGRVPDDLDELLKLKGVGRKTANLVLIEGYGKPGICVDTHVHRISNRLGWVKTKTPEQTEMALREKLPQKYWSRVNRLFVAFGKRICKPVSPLCSQCPLEDICPKIGVTKKR